MAARSWEGVKEGRLAAARCQGVPQSSAEGGAPVAQGERDQWDKHDAAHLILAPGRLWGDGAWVPPGPYQAAAGWSGAELSPAAWVPDPC